MNDTDDTTTGEELPPSVEAHRAATRTNSIRPTNLDDVDDPVSSSRAARRSSGNLT